MVISWDLTGFHGNFKGCNGNGMGIFKGMFK